MASDKKLSRMDEKVDEFRMRLKDSDQKQVFDDVFDTATLMALYDLSKKGYIDALGGCFSTGKEANLFHAIAKKDDISEVAVKIYMISTANFNSMKDYILGDPRFQGIRHARKDIILAWTKKEFKNLKFHFGTSSWGGTRKLPRAFTEQGVAMLSSVLRSKRAVLVNIEMMRAFVRLRQILATNVNLERRLNELEKKYDSQFKVVFEAIRQLMAAPEKPSKKIGFRLREKRAAYRGDKETTNRQG